MSIRWLRKCASSQETLAPPVLQLMFIARNERGVPPQICESLCWTFAHPWTMKRAPTATERGRSESARFFMAAERSGRSCIQAGTKPQVTGHAAGVRGLIRLRGRKSTQPLVGSRVEEGGAEHEEGQKYPSQKPHRKDESQKKTGTTNNGRRTRQGRTRSRDHGLDHPQHLRKLTINLAATFGHVSHNGVVFFGAVL